MTVDDQEGGGGRPSSSHLLIGTVSTLLRETVSMASMIRLNAVAGPSRALRCVSAQSSSPRTTALRSHAVRYNSSSASPSAKVTAVPFALKPEAAAHKMLMNGLIGSARAGNLFYSALLKFFGPGIMPYAKEFGLGESLVMRDMKAVYWPVWRVDAILEGRVRAENGSGKEGAAALVVEEGYIPGTSPYTCNSAQQRPDPQVTRSHRYHTSPSPSRLYRQTYQRTIHPRACRSWVMATRSCQSHSPYRPSRSWRQRSRP